MKNQIRIREPRRELLPGEVVVIFTWVNPPPPRPIPDPAKKFERLQEQLNKDPRRFKARCEFAGL